MRRAMIAGAVVAALAACVWAWLAFNRSEEDRIRDVIRAAAEGARKRKPSDVTCHLHERFMFKGLGKDEIHGILGRLLLQEFEVVEVSLPEPMVVNIEAGDKRARAEFRITVRCKQSREDKEWVDVTELAGGHRYALSLEKTDKGWKAVGAETVEEK